MANYHEEEVLGKAYDSVLMRRLIGYARPYFLYLILGLLMLLVITGIGLLRPYLLKVAIDNYIIGTGNVVYEYASASEVPDYIDRAYVLEHDGKSYVRASLIRKGDREEAALLPHVTL
ncbi:MAG TPA: hypothetical protein PLT03_05795, partial [Bacillota bacterium]|nr:hypothetical protein [Bacillota bacterium]